MREFNHSKAVTDAAAFSLTSDARLTGHQVDMASEGMNPAAGFRTSPPHLWTTSDLARFLVCSERNIFFLRNKGLPSVRVGGLVRFDPQAVREWLARQDEPADPREAQLHDIAASPETDAAERAASDLHKEFTSTP